MSEKNNKNILYCSFCGKSQHEVRKLIAGPTVFICDECVELCMDIIKEENKTSLIKHQDGVPTPKEICKVLDEYVISCYVNSPGGVVTAGLGIYDTMQYINSPVSTLCIGQASSMGSFLLAAGEKGKRFSLPNSRIMVHQPSAGFQGQATDIEIHAKEILLLKGRLNKIYAKHTGKSVEEISTALERDNFMTAEEAKKFGLIDSVVEKRK